MTRKPPEKHAPYYRLLEALRAVEGCALCQLEATAMHQYFQALLYENVNDPGVRIALQRARGYCHRHAHQVLGLANGLATAILYGDQVKLFLDFLTRLTGLLGRRRPCSWASPADCPACRVQQADRRRFVGILLDGLADDQMRTAFEAGPGLCVPHFLLVLESADGEARRQLVAVQQDKYQALLKDLEEFRRKHDYRYSRESFGRCADAWRRAVRMMVGAEGVF